MRIFLTNDDGYDAPGLVAMAAELEARGHDLIIVAPDRERSACSHSLTLKQPLHLVKRGENRWSFSGTPVDCVLIASEVLFQGQIPDLTISGINCGQNMGEDVLYSGTLAAALEAMLIGYKSVAISIRDYKDNNYQTAAKVMADFVDEGITDLVREREILNINIPNIGFDEIRGVKITRPGNRRYRNFVRYEKSETGEDIYYIGGNIPEWFDEEGTDFHAVKRNYVSITPVFPDYLSRREQSRLEAWVDGRDKYLARSNGKPFAEETTTPPKGK